MTDLHLITFANWLEQNRDLFPHTHKEIQAMVLKAQDAHFVHELSEELARHPSTLPAFLEEKPWSKAAIERKFAVISDNDLPKPFIEDGFIWGWSRWRFYSPVENKFIKLD